LQITNVFNLSSDYSDNRAVFLIMIKILLTLALVGIALSSKGNIEILHSEAPTPPPLPKEFRTNFTLSIVNFNDNANSLFTGYLAVNYINGGGLFEFGGEEFLPLYIHTNVIANPNTENITGYLFQGPLCWNVGEVPLTYLQLFPIEIPSNATYVGVQTVDGTSCTVWNWQESIDFYGADIQMWVSQKDSSIVRIVASQIEYIGNLQWDFQNRIVGGFNPNVYSPPNLDCITNPFGGGLSKRPILDTLMKAISML